MKTENTEQVSPFSPDTYLHHMLLQQLTRLFLTSDTYFSYAVSRGFQFFFLQ